MINVATTTNHKPVLC